MCSDNGQGLAQGLPRADTADMRTTALQHVAVYNDALSQTNDGCGDDALCDDVSKHLVCEEQ